MRYYFHLVKGSATIPDPDGVEVADIEGLPVEIAGVLREIASEDAAAGEGWNGWRLNVTASDGTVVLSIALDGPALNER
jgi:hypothetical protein